MKKLNLVVVIVVSLLASSFLNSALANDGNSKKEIVIENSNVEKEQSKNSNSAEAPTALQIIRFYTTCPDGTQQMVGAVGIHTNEYGQVTGINQDYWGEELACRDNQIIHWA